MGVLQWLTQMIAMIFNVALIVAAGSEVWLMASGIYEGNIERALQDGLFALIILEMFYVVRSFIKYGKVNTGLIISVGIVAVVKELIFKLKTLEMVDAIGFSILILSMAIALYIEHHHHIVKKTEQDFRSLKEQERMPFLFAEEEILEEEITIQA